MDLFGVAVVALVAALSIRAGIAKLRQGDIVVSVARYEMLPLGAVRVLAPAMPWVELALGFMLVFGVAPRIALSIASAMFLTFCAAILINLLRGRSIDCGCRGSGRPISWTLLAEDITCALACSAVAMIGNPVGLLQTFTTSSTGPGRSLAVVALLSAALGSLIYANCQESIKASRVLARTRVESMNS